MNRRPGRSIMLLDAAPGVQVASDGPGQQPDIRVNSDELDSNPIRPKFEICPSRNFEFRHHDDGLGCIE